MPTEGEVVVNSETLLGTELLGDNDAELGTIVDALVNAQGEVDFVVIELPASVGGAQVVLPWSALNFDVEQTRVLFEGALDDLQSTAREFELPVELENELVITTDGNDLDQAFNNLLRVSQLEALGLGDEANQLGTLAGALLNTQSGQIDYVVVDVSGLLGQANPVQVAVPWAQFNFDPAGAQALTIEVTPELLGTAPPVNIQDLEAWINLDEVTWDDQIRSFWEGAG
jgi:hypothetical protein